MNIGLSADDPFGMLKQCVCVWDNNNKSFTTNYILYTSNGDKLLEIIWLSNTGAIGLTPFWFSFARKNQHCQYKEFK